VLVHAFKVIKENRIKEKIMGFASLRVGLLAAILALPAAAAAFAQASPPNPSPPNPSPPNPSAPNQNTQAPAPTADAFGEDATLAAKTIIYVKGTGSWDKAFDVISGSLKKVKAYLDKEGIKPDGPPMTIFTATDDTGFEYQAAVPIAAAPKNSPSGELAVGRSPEGKALKFVHRGSYEELDNTYEAITNYLDERRLEARDLFIEEYVTDPTTTDPKKLVVNVYVVLKSG
jgi:effector-binding domain-containing protein